mgnify:CR=1 FL=1
MSEIEDLDKCIIGSDNGFTQYSIKVRELFTSEFNLLTITNNYGAAN